jgi:arylsulfatase
VLVQGDHFGGQALILDQGRPTYIFNSGDSEHLLRVIAPAPLAPGQHDVSVSFKPTERGGALVELAVDGKPVAQSPAAVAPRGRGEAYIGRRGIAPLFYDAQLPAIPERCGCEIEAVQIERVGN